VYHGRNASSIRDISLVERAVRQALLTRRLQEEGLDPRRIAALTAVRTELRAEVLDERGSGGSGIGGVIFGYSVALVLYMMILLYGQNILRGVLEEKTTRVAEVIVASVKPDVLLASKVLGVGAVGLTQVAAWLVMGVQLWQLRAPIAAKLGVPMPPLDLPAIGAGGMALLLAYFLLGYALYASLFAAVGAMVSNQEDAQQAATPVTLLVVMAVVFMQPVLLQPSGTMAQVVTLIPFTSPILMPLRLTSVQVPAWEIATSLALVALACAGCIWLSARIYRVGLLMYGKRPSMGELVRWVRQA
jgi:ABC-2 type transport system permease protein